MSSTKHPLYPPESYHHQLFVVIMKFTLPSLLLAVAAVFVPAACTPIPPVECAEASRFGILKIGPSTVAPGDVRRSHCLDRFAQSLIVDYSLNSTLLSTQTSPAPSISTSPPSTSITTSRWVPVGMDTWDPSYLGEGNSTRASIHRPPILSAFR